MAPPTSLQTSVDYRPALLWLMGELGTARTAEAIAEFERRLGQLIPQEHRELNSSGKVKWEHYVHWSRQYLVNVGLISSERRGIWKITEAGREWLRIYPDGNKKELSKLVQPQDRKPSTPVAKPDAGILKIQPASPPQNPLLSRDLFFKKLAESLQPKLTGTIGHGEVQLFPGQNWLQVCYPEFPRSHYEVALRRGNDELGFHFEAARDDNLARLASVQAHVDSLSQTLKHSLIAEPWGKNWARLVISFSPAPHTSVQAQQYAGLMAKFITETFPLLRLAFAATPARRQSPLTGGRIGPNRAAYAILDQQIQQIQEYLRGRAARPSDELLCEWVYFCYNFELFNESIELFNLIDPTAVAPWPYERAKRIAKVCRMRAAMP